MASSVSGQALVIGFLLQVVLVFVAIRLATGTSLIVHILIAVMVAILSVLMPIFVIKLVDE